MNDELVEVDTSKNSNFTSIEYKGSNLLFKRESNETLGLIRVLKTTSAITEIEIPLTIKDESNFKTIKYIRGWALQARNVSKVKINAKSIYGTAMGSNNKTKLIEIGESVEFISPNFNPYSRGYTIKINKNNTKYYCDDNSEILYENNGQTYKIILAIKKPPESNNATIVIPSNINGKNINEIAGYAFSEQNTIRTISIPDTITSIQSNAFSNCTNLITINIPSSVSKIGENAFDGCLSLEASANNGQGGIRIDNQSGSISGAPWGATKGDRAIKWLR